MTKKFRRVSHRVCYGRNSKCPVGKYIFHGSFFFSDLHPKWFSGGKLVGNGGVVHQDVQSTIPDKFPRLLPCHFLFFLADCALSSPLLDELGESVDRFLLRDVQLVELCPVQPLPPQRLHGLLPLGLVAGGDVDVAAGGELAGPAGKTGLGRSWLRLLGPPAADLRIPLATARPIPLLLPVTTATFVVGDMASEE